MNQQREKVSKTSKEISRENTGAKPKENTSKSSSKAPPRKYGFHSGLKLNFNVKKGPVIKPFSFETLTEKEKGIESPSSRKTDLEQSNKEEYADSGDQEETFMENLRFCKALDKANNKTQPTRRALDDSLIPSENENTDLCSNLARSLQHLSLNPKIVKSRVSNRMKPQPMPESLQVPSSATVKPKQPLKGAKDMTTKFAKPQTSIVETDKKKPHKKYGAHAGLKFPSIGKKETIIRPFHFQSRSPSCSRKCCSNSEGKQAESKEMSTPEGSHQKK